jgi:putative membrane protein
MPALLAVLVASVLAGSGAAMAAGDTDGNASHRDKSFVTKASEAGMAEVEMAKVAQSKATSPQVKDFAFHMVNDHQKANDELTRIANSKGITPSTSLSSKDQRELSKLQSLSGADFDHEYVKSQVSAHKDAVSLFDSESRRGTDTDLKQFAGTTLPTLQSHMDMVNNLAKAPKTASSQ